VQKSEMTKKREAKIPLCFSDWGNYSKKEEEVNLTEEKSISRLGNLGRLGREETIPLR
jgi:hypothetical protein